MSEKKKTLEKIRVRGSVPVNLRPATKIEVIICITPTDKQQYSYWVNLYTTSIK